MPDDRWALIIGATTVVVLRVVDWFMPKNFHSRWADRHGVEHKKDDQED